MLQKSTLMDLFALFKVLKGQANYANRLGGLTKVQREWEHLSFWGWGMLLAAAMQPAKVARVPIKNRKRLIALTRKHSQDTPHVLSNFYYAYCAGGCRRVQE